MTVHCSFCKTVLTALYYEGVTVFGAKAGMCRNCFELYGVVNLSTQKEA